MTAIYASVGSTERTRRKARLNVIRYADDFVITGACKEVLENKVMPVVRNFLATRGLELSEEKTRITHIAEGFDFLGQNVRKYNGKFLTKPSRKSIKSLLAKTQEIIKGNATAKQASLIQMLNPIIRGWAMYHRHSAAKTTFSSIDHRIWQMLWKWACRRHPNKRAQWVKDRYFRSDGYRNWDFGTQDAKHRCFRAATISIKRHVKIRGLANPFDPTWKEYFVHRRTTKSAVGWPGATPWR